MELRFVAPDLASLDVLDAEVLACPVWGDARPAHGVAGLCDWRLGGRISELQRRELVTGELGEVVMLPGKPRMSLDKLILFGAGMRVAFDEVQGVMATPYFELVVLVRAGVGGNKS